MRLRTREHPPPPTPEPPSPRPVKLVPVDAEYMLKLKSMRDRYLLGIPHDYAGWAIREAIPSLLEHAHQLAAGAEIVLEQAADVSPPAADRSEADDLRALLREHADEWHAADCDVTSGQRPDGCGCLGCRTHRAIEEG